jgi:hypothetical protein
MRRVPAVLVLAALLAAPAAAQVARVVALPEGAVSASLHPALLAPEGPAGAPLVPLLSAGALRVADAVHADGPQAAAPALTALAAEGPAERASAAVLARALSDTREAAVLLMRAPDLMHGDLPALAGRRLPLGEAAGLAETARRDPGLSFLFDGGRAPRVSVPADAVLEDGTLSAAGRRLPALGRGFFAFVHPHPEVEGAVIKTDLPRGLKPMGESPGIAEARMDRDRETAEAAAAADVGPRLLGAGTVGGRPALVKERVYGPTVQELLDEGRFTAEDHALVEEMFARAARAGLSFADPRAENVMIGRTLTDPRVRAYLVDGGAVFPGKDLPEPEMVERHFSIMRELIKLGEHLQAFDLVHFSRPLPK